MNDIGTVLLMESIIMLNYYDTAKHRHFDRLKMHHRQVGPLSTICSTRDY
jgi:hypothetical protein